jgi:hypothetical protein
MLLAAMRRAFAVIPGRAKREPGISRFRVRSFHDRAGMTVLSHPPAASGFTHSNSGS